MHYFLIDIYDIPWFDSILKIIERKESELLVIIEEGHSLRCIILLKIVGNVYKEKEYDISRIIFTEIL